jgi:phage-related protein
MTIPESHLAEGQKLTADAEVDLFQLTLVSSPTIFRFKNDNTVVWQGLTWEGMGCSITGDKRSANEEEGRPTLRVINPEGLFNKPAMDGLLDRAILIRKRVLGAHITANTNIFQQRMWYVERVKELISGQMLGLELRAMTDLPNVQIPYRVFMPPEFPTVSL